MQGFRKDPSMKKNILNKFIHETILNTNILQ